jgi:hypothetical protein
MYRTVTISVKLHVMQNQWNWFLLYLFSVYIRMVKYSYKMFPHTCDMVIYSVSGEWFGKGFHGTKMLRSLVKQSAMLLWNTFWHSVWMQHIGHIECTIDMRFKGQAWYTPLPTYEICYSWPSQMFPRMLNTSHNCGIYRLSGEGGFTLMVMESYYQHTSAIQTGIFFYIPSYITLNYVSWKMSDCMMLLPG